MSGADDVLDPAEIDRLARAQDRAAGYREAARQALAFARRYRAEEGSAGGPRERACIDQAQAWRRAVRELHATGPAAALPAVLPHGPGLARARADQADLAEVPAGSRKLG